MSLWAPDDQLTLLTSRSLRNNGWRVQIITTTTGCAPFPTFSYRVDDRFDLRRFQYRRDRRTYTTTLPYTIQHPHPSAAARHHPWSR